MRKVLLIILIGYQSYAAQIFYFDRSSVDQCVAKLADVPSGKETKLFATKECPENVIWDFNKKILYYLEGQKLFSRGTSQTQESAKKMADLPKGQNYDLKIDPQSQIPILSYLVPVAEKDFKTVGDGENKKEVFTFEGKKYETSELPSWGVPYMAIRAHLVSGKWQREIILPTKSDAGETPDLTVLPEQKSFGFSLVEEKSKMTCHSKNFECDIQDKKIKKIVGAQEDDAAGRIAGSKKGQFLFTTKWGDSNHAVSPVYFCDYDCKSPKKLIEVIEDQIAFSINGTYLLITSEYSNEDPKIYDASNGKFIFRKTNAQGAIWFKGK